MKLQNLPEVPQSAIEGQAGIILEVDPAKVDAVPFWDSSKNGGMSGMVALVRFGGQAYLATRLAPEWLVLVSIAFKET